MKKGYIEIGGIIVFNKKALAGGLRMFKNKIEKQGFTKGFVSATVIIGATAATGIAIKKKQEREFHKI